MGKLNKQLGWLLQFFKPQRWVLLVVFILAIIGTALDLIYPYLSKVFIDDVLIQPKYSLKNILLLTLTLTIVSIVLQAVNSYIYLRTTLQIVKQIRLYIFNHLERLRYTFFVRTRLGDITTRLNGDINVVQATLTDGVLQLCITVLTLIFITTVLIILDLKLFIISVVIFPLLVFLLLYFKPIITNKTRQLREDQGSIQGHIIETFSQIRLVKLLTAEREQCTVLGDKIDTLNKHSLQYAIIESVAGGIPRILIAMMTTLILFIGGAMVLNGEMTVGSLLAFTTYLSRFFSPVQTLAGLYIRFQNMFVSLNRLTEYLAIPTEDNRVTNIALADTQPVLKCRNVAKKIGAEAYLLQSFNMDIVGNKSYALVGVSGSGKSTTIDLLVRLQEHTQGSIEYKGMKIEHIPVAILRKEIFVVAQDVELLHSTLKDNLLVGLNEQEKQHITDERLIEVCRQVGLHREVMQLPAGYNTLLGEKGKVLSGGQRQRIAIARGLLREPTILILDEATSGLDYELESELIKVLQAWQMRQDGRVLLFVSHRHESLKFVDEWLLIQNQQITTGLDYMQVRQLTAQWHLKEGVQRYD